MSITSTQLQQQYIAYFGRPGDPEGINYWTSDATDISTAAEFAEKIYAQPEYQTTTIASKTTSEQVNQLYVNLFARSADAEGLLYWTTEIEKGTLSLSNLAFDLISAASNPIAGNEGQAAQDAATLNAKTSAAEAYTSAVAGNASALMAYQPGAAYESAVSFISSVSFNAQVNQAVITTGGSLAPLSAGNVNAFVSQMLQSQAVADAATAQADAATAQADALADAQAAQLQAAQLQAAQAEAAAAQATLANQQAIATAAAEAAAEAEAAAAAPQTLILKTTLDQLTGGSDADLFNGAAGTIDSDILDGGDGDDTLKVTLSNAGDDGAAFQTSNIENFKFRTTGAVGLDLGDVTGVTSITAERNAGNLELTDLIEIPTSVTIDRASAGANLTIALNGTTAEGTTDEITLNVSQSSNSGATTIDSIETVNVVSTDDPAGTTTNDLDLRAAGSSTATEVVNISGTGDLTARLEDALTINNSASGDVTITPVAATTIAHTGSGKLTVASAAVASTTTASGTGALTFTAGAAVQSVTGSTGDDRFDFQATLASTDTVAGGDGTDTLVVLGESGILGGAFTLVSGIETLEIDTEDDDNSIDFDNFGATQAAAITTVNVDLTAGAQNSNAHEVTLTNTQATTYGVSSMTDANGHTLVDLTIDLEDASGTDTAITLNLNNKQTAAAGNDLLITTLSAAGVETITINADSVLTGAASTVDEGDIEIGTLTATSLTTLNINGDADFLYDNAAGLEDGITTINASGATDEVDLLLSPTSGAVTYTGGSGADTLRFGTTLASTDSVDGGDGSDTVTATFSQGTVTPSAMTSVENFDATFSGGALNASNFGDLTTINIADINATAVISGIPATTTTINQIATTAARGLNLQYATGADATVSLTNIGTAGNIANASTTVNNVKNLTVDITDHATTVDADSDWDLGSLTAGTALTDLTLISNQDADDDLTVGNISAANLENLTINADEGFINVGTLTGAGELKTISITNLDADSSGQIDVGAIGNITAADELTSFSIVTSGDADEATGTQVVLSTVDAASATAQSIDTFTIDLNGNYGSSGVGVFTADDIAAINITTGVDGTILNLGGFVLSGSVAGDVNISNGASIDDNNGATFWSTETSGSIGNFNFTNTGAGAITLAQNATNDIFVDVATTIGNITVDTGTSTSGTNDVMIGEFDNVLTMGNIAISGSGSVGLDAFNAATSIGNITGSVEAGEQHFIGDTLAGNLGNSGVIGAADGVMGSTTITGAGNFGMAVGPVATLGNIDLSGMNAATSGSDIRLSETTVVGVVFDGSTGSDTFIGTGGSDVITPGLGSDEITAGGGADLIDLTETVDSVDTVIITGDAIGNTAVDTVTGFSPTTDKIAWDISALNALKGSSATAGEVVNLITANGELTETIAGATPLGLEGDAAAIIEHDAGDGQAGNIWFIKSSNITAVPASNVATTSLEASMAVVDGDMVPTMYWNSTDGVAVAGVTEHITGNVANTFPWNVLTFSPSVEIPMTFAQYEDIYTNSQEEAQIEFV